jgi:Flp pilus assembly protein TadG
MRSLLRNLRDSEDGQALTELALVLPILLIVLLAILDFGRAINYWNDETHVANLAARYAAVGVLPTTAQDKSCGQEPPMTESTLKAYILCQAKTDSSELAEGSKGKSGTQGGLGVCVSIPKAEVGAPVTIKLTSNYKWLPFLPVRAAQTTVSGTATNRLEQIPSFTSGAC